MTVRNVRTRDGWMAVTDDTGEIVRGPGTRARKPPRRGWLLDAVKASGKLKAGRGVDGPMPAPAPAPAHEQGALF